MDYSQDFANFVPFSNPKTRTNLSNKIDKSNTTMKKIDINIKHPYKKYNALLELRVAIGRVYEDLKVADEEDNGEVLRRIDSIMDDLEYYKRNDSHAQFCASYHWELIPDRLFPESIEIRSITDKEVGCITIK